MIIERIGLLSKNVITIVILTKQGMTLCFVMNGFIVMKLWLILSD